MMIDPLDYKPVKITKLPSSFSNAHTSPLMKAYLFSFMKIFCCFNISIFWDKQKVKILSFEKFELCN